MPGITRRTVINRSIGAVAAGALARPFVANAQAKTVTVWWQQGFVPEEDEATRVFVDDFQKAAGAKVELSIVPFAPLRQKIISAITSGVVPDMIYAAPPEVLPLQAWEDRLVDVSDVVETQKSKMLPVAVACATTYNNVTKKRSIYGVPFAGAVVPFHIWRTLVEKAGFKEADIPNTWDKFIDFFIPVQQELKKKGMRHTYATGFVVSTIGNDPTNTFVQFLIAYGGQDIVTPDGKFHGSDPKIKQALVQALTRLSKLYTDGYIPPSSINWNDADDNNAFHSKLCVMDFDGTLSTELAMLRKQKDEYNDVITRGPPLTNDGKPMASQFGVNTMIIPKGAKNVEVGKEWAKFMIQPEVLNKYLKGGLGRWLPIYPELIKNDSWWTDPKRDSHLPPYVHQGFEAPTIPDYYTYTPAWAQVRSEHPYHIAFHDIVAGGMTPEAATDKASKRCEEIFAKFEIKA
jgi:multiple sugar transport system substrate-binding protein